MRSIHRYIVYRPRKIAYRQSKKFEVNMLFYKVDISMDCTESIGYICYIIFKLTNSQVDAS